MSAASGDLCQLGRSPMPAHMVTHYRCDDYADGTVTDARTGEIVNPAPAGALRGFNRDLATKRAPGLTLDNAGQFVTFEGNKLGVIASKKRGRWQYRSAESGHAYGSGMSPADFAKQFWNRDDFAESAATA